MAGAYRFDDNAARHRLGAGAIGLVRLPSSPTPPGSATDRSWRPYRNRARPLPAPATLTAALTGALSADLTGLADMPVSTDFLLNWRVLTAA
jgi:hypothetical protein